MKTLEEIRELFVSARNIAKEASPAKAEEAAGKIKEISDHCKELYEIETSYVERARCRNMFESLDNIVSILSAVGFVDERVGAFFGLNKSTRYAPSFSDISSGKGTVKKPVLPEAPLTSSPVVSPVPAFDLGSLLSGEQQPLAMPETEPELPSPASVGVAEPMPAASVLSVGAVPAMSQSKGVSGNGQLPVEKKDQLEPQSLDEFIGQEHIVRRLKEEIEAARILGRSHLDNILLFGTRGLGKSTLMELIAKELGVTYKFLDCTSLMNNTDSQKRFHQFFMNIASMDEPVVIALDEIHALTPRLQSCLLTLLNSRVYSYLSDNGETKNFPIREFTFIGATTDYDAVLATLKDRCSNLTFLMKDYTRDELVRILRNKFKAVGLTATEEALQLSVNRCRSSLRDVKAIVLGVRTKALISKTNEVTKELVEWYFKDKGTDPIGLSEKELEILRAIANEPRGAISEETLSARVYLDSKILTKEYEPYLMKIGFISINSRGRSLTPKAEEYLKYGYFEFADGTVVGTKPTPDGSMDVAPPPAPVEPSLVEPIEAVPATLVTPVGTEESLAFVNSDEGNTSAETDSTVCKNEEV